MLRMAVASCLLALIGVAQGHAASLIEISGGKKDIEFKNWMYPDQYPSFKQSVSFHFSFYDNNGDYIFNSGDVTPFGQTYESFNYYGPDYFDPSRTLQAGLDKNGNPFYRYHEDYYYNYNQETKDFYSVYFSILPPKMKGYMSVLFGDGDLYSYIGGDYISYEFKINGVSQVVPVPWSVALLPAGLALLGGIARRRRAVGEGAIRSV